MLAALTTPAPVHGRLARRLLLLSGATVGAPVAVVTLLVVGVAAGPIAGVVAALVAGAAAGWVVARRLGRQALPEALRGLVLEKSGTAPTSPQWPRLDNLLDGLCLTSGVTKPRVVIVEDAAANSMVAAVDPAAAVLVVTTGLLDALSRVELEGVLAHELSHLRGGDVVPATLAVTTGPLLGRVPWGRAAIAAATDPTRELSADVAGVTLTRYPPGLLSGLEKVAASPPGPAAASPATGHLWLRPLAGALESRIETLREL